MHIDVLADKIKSSGSRVVLYGMSHMTELAILGMAMKGIHPDIGYDRSPVLYIRSSMHGIPIELAENIINEPKDAYIFLVITYDFYKIKASLNDAGFSNIFDATDFMELVDIDCFGVDALRPEFEAYGAPRITDIGAFQLHEASSRYKREFRRYCEILEQGRTGAFHYINSILVVLGTRCILRCRDCCAEVQYYDGKEMFPLDQIKSSLERIFSAVDVVNSVTLSGCEPLLYKHMMDVVRFLNSSDKVSYITISTTGGIIPADDVFAELDQYGVQLQISDYGDTVKNREKFIERASNFMRFPFQNLYTVPYNEKGIWIEKPIAWCDTGSFADKNHTPEELNKLADNCNMRKNLALYGDKLYHCWRSAGCMRLGVLPEMEGEVLTLSDTSLDNDEFRRQLANMADFTRDLAPLRACSRCRGLKLFDRPVAVQSDHRMEPYEKDGYIS